MKSFHHLIFFFFSSVNCCGDVLTNIQVKGTVCFPSEGPVRDLHASPITSCLLFLTSYFLMSQLQWSYNNGNSCHSCEALVQPLLFATSSVFLPLFLCDNNNKLKLTIQAVGVRGLASERYLWTIRSGYTYVLFWWWTTFGFLWDYLNAVCENTWRVIK